MKRLILVLLAAATVTGCHQRVPRSFACPAM